MLRPLDPHQVIAVKVIRDLKGQALLAMAPGTGKTIPAIRTARLPALVICRRDDFLTWQIELKAEGYPASSILLIKKGSTPVPAKIRQTEYEWVIITYDLAKTKHLSEWIMRQSFACAIADECHSIKGPKSQRTKKAIKCTRHIPRRLGMSGSVIGNDPIDLFSQVLFIDNGKLLGNNWWKFRNKYYLQSGPGWYLKRTAKADLQKLIAKISYYVHEDDVLKLPPVRKLLKAVPPTAQQVRAYEEVLTSWELTLHDGTTMDIDQVIVQLNKLRQICSGFFYYYPDPANKKVRSITHLKEEKTNLLLSLLKDPAAIGNKPKVVIAAAHTAQLGVITRALDSQNITYVTYYGDMSGNDRERARIRFRDHPDVRCFIAQADRLTGMNELIVSDTMVYMSNSQKALSRQQSMRRVRRRGSEHHKIITYWDLVTEGTVEVPLVSSIANMMSLAHHILSGIKEGKPLRGLLQ